MKKIPSIDFGECTRCCSCVEVCPEVFSHNEAGDYIEVADLEAYPEGEVQEAIKLCPADCISWEFE